MMEKTLEMVRFNIHWREVAKELNVTTQAVYNWRIGDEAQKHQVIELAIESIVEKRKEENK